MKIGNQIIRLDTVDSTNNYAIKLLKEQNNIFWDGTIVISKFQADGRGQIENKWESEADKNLLLSIIIFPEKLEASLQFILSKYVCLAIFNYLKNKNINAQIKWPNDIYVANKKIAGILIENTIQGVFIKTSIFGIGLNINQIKFSENTKNAISLKNILNQEFDLQTELNLLISEFNILFDRLQRKDYKYFDNLYLNNLYKLNVVSIFKNKTQTFEAKIIGITNLGQLVVERINNLKEIYDFKEIQFIDNQ